MGERGTRAWKFFVKRLGFGVPVRAEIHRRAVGPEGEDGEGPFRAVVVVLLLFQDLLVVFDSRGGRVGG